MLRGTPGRYSSAKPCRRFWTNLERHLPTVGLEHLSSAATTSFVFPSAQANTIFDLKARACGLFGRRAQRERVSLSSSDSTRGAFGRPRSRSSFPRRRPTRSSISKQGPADCSGAAPNAKGCLSPLRTAPGELLVDHVLPCAPPSLRMERKRGV